MGDLATLAGAELPPDLAGTLGVAVSGGSDSLALLMLLNQLASVRGFELQCCTVDHGLRPEAADEAESVARFCADIGVAHQTLRWTAWKGTGNVQNAARDARYALMSDWARENGIGAIALGHTQDDQAETVLMRLARGAGVDGLSAMAAHRHKHGILWLRPLLGIGRADLRSYLTQCAVTWTEDPSNDDTRFERIKARQALDVLAHLGIERATLANVAQNMQSARSALDQQVYAAAQTGVAVKAGGLQISWEAFSQLPDEIARRLVVASLKWISGAGYAPRHKSLMHALASVHRDGTATLEGCLLHRAGQNLWIFREYNAVRDVKSGAGMLWDGRWELKGGAFRNDLHVAALGERGLAQCADWRAEGLPRALLLAAPGVWQAEKLCAAPHAGWAQGWSAVLKKGESSFLDGLISH